MRYSWKIKLGNLWMGGKFWTLWRRGFKQTEGIYDLCEDGSRILFFDYDMMRLRENWMKQQIKAIQEEFKLSDFIIFESSEKGFHAICFDKCTSQEINDMIKRTSSDDSFRQNWRYDYVPRVLRTSAKGGTSAPKFLYTLKSKYNRRQKSYAHMKYYENKFKGLKVTNKKNNDSIKKFGVISISYPTKVNV